MFNNMNPLEFALAMTSIYLAKAWWYFQGLWNPRHRGSSWFANNRILGDLVQELHAYECGDTEWIKDNPPDFEQRCREAFERYAGRPYKSEDALKSHYFWARVAEKRMRNDVGFDRHPDDPPTEEHDYAYGAEYLCNGLCDLHRPLNDRAGYTQRLLEIYGEPV